MQSGLSTAFQSTQSAYFQQHTWQHEGVLAVADMRSTRLQTINQILGREGTMHNMFKAQVLGHTPR